MTDKAQAASTDPQGLEMLRQRDRALAALDGGTPLVAFQLMRDGLVALDLAGMGGGLDAAMLLLALSEIEESLDHLMEARRTIEKAVAILDNVPCGSHEETLGSATDPLSSAADPLGFDEDTLLLWCQAHERLAGLQRMAGEFDKAAARLNGVLDRASPLLGECSLPVVSASNALGVVCKHAGQFDAAEAAYERALAGLAGLEDPDPLMLACLLHNQGGLAHSRGNASTGIPLAEQGLALRLEMLGCDHPDTARDLNALGALYHLAGELDAAAEAYRQALSIFETSYGLDHLEVAMTCANLAVLASDRARPDEAEGLGRRALAILESVLGPGHVEVGLTLLNLAAALDDQAKATEAKGLLTRADAIFMAELPPFHPHAVAAARARERFGTLG